MTAMQGFDLETYLSDAYQGEVFGEAFFALLAERADDSDQAAKWRLLEHLERHVKGRLRQELERRGLPRDESPAMVEEGRKAACGAGAFPSGVDARAFRDTMRGVVEQYRASRDAAPKDLKEIAEFVLGHEQALLEFAERELAGEGAKSTQPVEEFLAQTGADKDVPIPEGIQLTPLDDAYRDDPYPVLAELRRRAPVHRDRAFGRFVLTRHDDVMRVLRDLEFWVDVRKSNDDNYFRRLQLEQIERNPSMMTFLRSTKAWRIFSMGPWSAVMPWAAPYWMKVFTHTVVYWRTLSRCRVISGLATVHPSRQPSML